MYFTTRLRILWYTKPSLKPYLGFLFLMGGFLALMGLLHASGNMDDASWAIFCWVGGGIILGVLIPYFGGYLRILSALRRANKAGRLYELYEDFEDAQPIANGYAKLGRRWFFGRGGRNVVACEDIRSVHLHEHYAGLQRNQRELHYTDVNGKEHPLCGLPLFGKKSETIAQEIISAISPERRYPSYPEGINEPSHGGR